MNAHCPIDIATRHTADFIAAHSNAGARLLEVGCGRGHLAAELQRRGFAVTGVDADAESVAEARTLGVGAIQCEWPDCAIRGEDFDAVAFTRSLHHIERLDDAVAAAKRSIRSGGILLLEDFSCDEADPKALEWFADVLTSGAGLLAAASSGLVAALQQATDWPAAWRRYHSHDHQLHTIASMRAAISAQFTIRAEARVPYLYRYLIPLLPNEASAAAWLGDVLAGELRAAEAGRFEPVGRRIVAVR
jgi:SAM-dependent methyltransferase